MVLFADTSFYVALVSPKDVNHPKATECFRTVWTRVITTEFVILELGNWLSKLNDREAFLKLNRRIRSDPQTLVIPCESELIAAGVDLFAKRCDKEWSLTDCISFVVMERHGITDALSADHHFEQAGYKLLL